MKRVLWILIWSAALLAAPTHGAEFIVNSSQGAGWIILSLDDLNTQLVQAGFPALANRAAIYGGTTTFPQENKRWMLGFSALFWNSKGGDAVRLDSSFFGGLLDWTLHNTRAGGRFSSGVILGFSMADLTIRKGLAFGFDDLLAPNKGQFSIAQRWGVYSSPYIQYELQVLESDFVVRATGGFLLTPWLSNWSQAGALLDLVEFPGPPANLGGPFVTAELSFGF